MSIPKNAFLSNSFFIFITRFFPSLANLAVLVWYSRNLSPAVYGGYQAFWIQLNVLYPIACFGIHVLMVTYAPDFVIGLLRKLTRKHFIVYGFWIIALGLVFAWLQGKTGMNTIVPFLFFVSFSISLILESFLVVFRKFGSIVTISVLYSCAFWLAHWAVLKSGFSLQLIFAYLLVISITRLFLYGGITLVNIRKYSSNSIRPELTLPNITSLWLHLAFYDISQVLFNWIDKFVISLLFAAGISAVYMNGSMTIPFLPLLTSAAGSAVLVQLAAGAKKDEKTNAVLLMNQTGRVLSCIVFPVFFYLMFFRHELMLLLGEKYLAAVPVFMVSILVLPVRAYSFTTVLQRLHKGTIINAGAIADLLFACLLMYPLYQWLGLPGVALSFVISTYFQATFYLVYTARLLQINPLKLLPVLNWVIKLIVFATLFITIHYGCSLYFTGNISLILAGMIMVAIIVVSLIIEFKSKSHVSS